MDYAVYIIHSKHGTRKTSVVTFLQRQTGWKKYLLESNTAGDESIPSINYLTLAKKGSRDYDYQRDKKFTYPHDSIFVGFFEKAGVTYVYGKGRFRQIVTSDWLLIGARENGFCSIWDVEQSLDRSASNGSPGFGRFTAPPLISVLRRFTDTVINGLSTTAIFRLLQIFWTTISLIRKGDWTSFEEINLTCFVRAVGKRTL